jgi:hypothetical protein
MDTRTGPAHAQTWFVTDISMEKPKNEPFCLMDMPTVPEFWRFTGMVVRTEAVGRGGTVMDVGL